MDVELLNFYFKELLTATVIITSLILVALFLFVLINKASKGQRFSAKDKAVFIVILALEIVIVVMLVAFEGF